ncbi:MAG: ROK family protein [Cytophagales bacterium]|nr:ROK family protein [Cytophagales bacterium]
MPAYYLSIDLGGTKCAGAVISDTGSIIVCSKAKIAETEGDGTADVIMDLSMELIRNSGLEKKEFAGIGVSVPGISYKEKGTVWAPNIPGWEDYPLRDKILHTLHITGNISIDNDRACSIMGEYWLGAARKCKDAIYLAFGTGIGAGIIADGRVLRGQSDIAGSIGWMVLDDRQAEGYKQFGCFEYNASGDGLRRVAEELYTSDKNYRQSILGPGNMNAVQISKAFEKNDPLAVEVMKSAIHYWGKGVANLVSIFNPEKIIFGGGLFGPALQFLDEVYEEAKKYAQPIAIGQVEFCPGPWARKLHFLGRLRCL